MSHFDENLDSSTRALISVASDLVKVKKAFSNDGVGNNACALMSRKGAIYSGISVDMKSDFGLCAEQAAIADMLKHGESNISILVSVSHLGDIVVPCGKCLEFIQELNPNNNTTIVLLPDGSTRTVSYLLPKLL